MELRKQFGYRLGFGATSTCAKWNPATGTASSARCCISCCGAVQGRWVAQSDHSVSSDVAPESYAYMLEVVREYGVYPLDVERITREIAALDAPRA